MKNLLIGIATAFAVAQAASAAQIVLSPASVIGSSGHYTACCDFQPGNILDQQTGPVTESFGSGYWLNPDNGPVDAFLTIDLGAVYNLTAIQLFNTHNGGYGDRGTGTFQVFGSNAESGGMLVNPTLLLAGSLGPELAGDGTVLTAQTFGLSGSFRYLSFNPTSDMASPNGFFGPYVRCCSANVYGLNEMRVFAPVPEPGTWSLLMAGFGLAGAMARRRQSWARA